MASNSSPSPGFIANPFIKKRNLDWTLKTTVPLGADIEDTSSNSSSHPPISPTASTRDETEQHTSESQSPGPPKPTTAAVESGAASTDDHLSFFASSLRSRIRTRSSPGDDLPDPLLSISSYQELYRSQAGSREGAHFVIHQHDHPVAGTHYDLRLQINETSSVSWAIMYGLPGDPNSLRLNRNATETRIHCLWNHLIETASEQTGSLLIWDTGTYSILPRRSKYAPTEDPSSPQRSPEDQSSAPSQQDLLHAAFKNRKIKLRLHGSKLPDPYVLNLRLTKTEDVSGRARSARNLSTTPRKRRRRNTQGRAAREKTPQDSSDQEELDGGSANDDDDGDDSHLVPQQTADGNEGISALEKELRELEDDQVRKTNAYPGAFNTIGSIHQRRWYLSLERPSCGFERLAQQRWEPPKNEVENNGAQDKPRSKLHPHGLCWPFYVRGADHEYSVVTGRRGVEILQDEGVTGFVPRMGWRPVLN